jgi:hypothetical protein
MTMERCRWMAGARFAYLALIALAIAGGATRASAALNECLVSVNGVPDAAANGGTVTCADCDPTCDTDGVSTPDKMCRFNLQVCPNSGCNPLVDIKKVKVKKVSGKCKVTGLAPTATGTSSACGAFTGVTVKLKKRDRPGKCKIRISAKSKTRPRQNDKDIITLQCDKQPATTCPTTTTTTPVSTTTTTTEPPCPNGTQQGLEECDDGNQDNTDACTNVCQLARCGDGFLQSGEQCDPPCGSGTCGSGEICNGSCQCVAAAACTCGTPTPTKLVFTNTAPLIGNCGMILDDSSANLLDMPCGGLFFGGGAVGVPLPAAVPDMGTSITKTCCNGGELTLGPTTATDTGSARTCTSRDCLFGAPLPIPNYANTAISTCVINVIAKNGVGRLECGTGLSELNLPLTSQVYLTADLLNGTTADRPDVPGTQPCPVCSRVCSGGDRPGLPCASDPDCTGGGTCAAAATCLGGPNHSMACTPGTSPLPGAGDPADTPYPTSHDCPPPSQPIGFLPIGFALTTEQVTKSAVASGSQQRVFCGFCRDTNGTFYFEGDPNGLGGALRPCTSNADCAEPWESCEQNNTGAFHQGTAAQIVETGARPANITDQSQPHDSTLVSVFCIPPTFNAAIDPTADLPGPGAVSLPGRAQLMP